MRAQGRPGKAWLILALLFLFTLINFADKIIVGLAGVLIIKDLGLTPTQFGQLGSAFFLLFSLSAIAIGFVVNRVKTKWVIAVLAAIWALTQFPMMGSIGFAGMLLSRVALGAGEGPAFPVAIHAAYKWFPNEKRTLPSAVLSLGSAVGVFVAAPVLTYVIYHVSWHAAFGLLGIVGLVWVAVWLVVAEEGRIQIEPSHASFRESCAAAMRPLRSSTMIGACITGWVAYWGLALALTWIPTYASTVMHYSPETIGYLTAIQWLAGGLLVFGGGALSQWLKKRGSSSRRCRGVFGAACVAAGGVATIVMSHLEPGIAQMMLLVLGFGLPSVIFSLVPAMIGEIVPSAQRGALLGINTAVITTAGLIAPFVMGKLIETAASADAGYQTGMLWAGLLSIGGGLAGLLLLHPDADAQKLGAAASLSAATETH